MLDRLKHGLKSCRSVYSRRRELTTKLLQNPFFPILFIGEAIKSAAVAFATAGTLVTPTVIVMAVLAVIVTLIWLFAEVLLKNAEEYTDDVIDSGKDALDKATDGDSK